MRGDAFLLWLFPIVDIIIVIILRSVNFRAGESKSSLLNDGNSSLDQGLFIGERLVVAKIFVTWSMK